jgi:hypothetical protein
MKKWFIFLHVQNRAVIPVPRRISTRDPHLSLTSPSPRASQSSLQRSRFFPSEPATSRLRKFTQKKGPVRHDEVFLFNSVVASGCWHVHWCHTPPPWLRTNRELSASHSCHWSCKLSIILLYRIAMSWDLILKVMLIWCFATECNW